MYQMYSVQLFRGRLSEKMCTRQFRKVIRYDQFTVPDTVAFEPTFVTFLLHLQTYIHGLSCHSLKISLKNSELKTTHKTFRDCRVHFFRQPFSK